MGTRRLPTRPPSPAPPGRLLAAWALVAASLLALPGAPRTAEPPVAVAPVTVALDGSELSVRTEGPVAAERLLEAVAAATGIAFEIDPALRSRPIEVEIEGAEIERALARLVAAIPGAGGLTSSYESAAAGELRLVRVRILAASTAPDAPPPAETPTPLPVETPALEVATPSAAELEAQRRHLLGVGVPEETVERFLGFVAEMPVLRRTPGALEELIRSEEYRRTIREIGEGQGKGGGAAPVVPAP